MTISEQLQAEREESIQQNRSYFAAMREWNPFDHQCEDCGAPYSVQTPGTTGWKCAGCNKILRRGGMWNFENSPSYMQEMEAA